MIEMPERSGAPMPHASPRPFRRSSVYRGLPRPVQVVVWLATSVILGIVIGATLPGAMRRLGATAALAPGMLAWYGVRATGFLAYFAIAGSVIFGLLLSTKLLDAIAHRPVSLTLHKDLALVGLALSVLHGLLLLGDHTFAFTPAAIAIPFASPYAPIAVGVGQLAFYVMVIVTGSFYVRRQVGQRAWRLIHYLTFCVFVGVTAHGITSGSDTTAPWATWAYLVPISATVFFLVYRVIAGIAERSDRMRPGHVPITVANAVKRPMAARRTSTQDTPAPTTARMRVLVVEDEHRLGELIRRVLLAEHHAVDLAEDGAGALALALAGGYDVIVLDRMLPDLDGSEVLRLLRSRGDRTPVLLLTALGSVEQRVAGLDAGADDYLTKPFAFSELLARLQSLTSRPPAANARALGGDIALEAGPGRFFGRPMSSRRSGAPMR